MPARKACAATIRHPKNELTPMEGITQEKNEINIKIAKMARERWMPGKTTIYIEGQAARTTRTMRQFGIPSSACIPINNDIDNVKAIRKNCAGFGEFRDVVCQINPVDACLIWYDSCQTLTGNQSADRIPSRDIAELLACHDLCCILAVTFCCRSRRGMGAVRSRRAFLNLLKSQSYEYEEIEYIPYGRMCFMAVKIFKSTPIPDNSWA